MNAREADTVLALLRHLDGSHIFDETDLVTSLIELHASAACDVAGALPLDEDTLLDTLAHVGERHTDAANYAQDWAGVP